MVQAFCLGEEFSIDLICDMDGRCLEAVPRSMIESKGGETIKGESLDDPALRTAAVRVAEALGIKGPACVQCFRDGDDYLVTDVNARFGGGFPVHVASGGGYPDIVLALARGERTEPRLGAYRAGVIMVRYLSQVILERDGADALAPGSGRIGPAHAARRLKLVYSRAVAAGGADDVEIALGVYVRRVVRRWWIVLAAIVVAVAISLAGTSSGSTRYRAQTLISLGTPYTATGGAAITSAFCTSPIAPATLIKQDEIREVAERAAGLEVGELKGHASSQAVAGAVTKLNFTPAVNIIVQGPWKGTTTARASVALAEQVRDTCSTYAGERLKTTEARLARELEEQDTLSDRFAGAQKLLADVQADKSLSATERALAATVAANTLSNVIQRQNQLDQFIGDDQALVQQIRNVELTQIITRGKATKVTAGGKSASLGVAIVLGAIAGIALALLSYVVAPTRRKGT